MIAYRIACADAAKPVIQALSSNDRVVIEGYANSEFWAGWNAAIEFAAKIALNRHDCWKESSVGSSVPECDVSACEDISIAIRGNLHHRPPVSRPRATTTAEGVA